MSIRFLFILLVWSFNCVALESGGLAVSCNINNIESTAQFDLKKYDGKVILIDFWATWCPPCKQSMPFLNDLYNKLHDKGFVVLAINVDEDSSDAQEYLIKYPVDYPVVFDPLGNCPKKYAVKAMPSSYFIDRQGKVRFVHLGFRSSDEDVIYQYIDKLLQEK